MPTPWTFLHPRMDEQRLGPYLPYFLDERDPRPAREQYNSNYKFGGWQPSASGNAKVKLNEDNSFDYPGDPRQYPIAMTKLRDELILLFPGDFVMIVQPDRSFEMARLD